MDSIDFLAIFNLLWLLKISSDLDKIEKRIK